MSENTKPTDKDLCCATCVYCTPQDAPSDRFGACYASTGEAAKVKLTRQPCYYYKEKAV
ncbi:MAG: hypothetical protein GY832_21955 [Chloroflexi bacterium]|nr:hypothetical protein [Chloroflexota bacterium]